MILATPLVIPFAEAVGISIATLGMAKAADMVNEYIQENPEESMKILSTIVPNIGIGQIFANKEDSDEEISEDIDVEVEEKPKKLSGKEKGMRIKEAIRRARAGRGNYSSPDAEGDAVDIRGSVIREVEDMGIADKNLKDKPYKEKGYDFRDYIPKGAYRRRKADGGSIGIEVLFEPKRKDFSIGGNVQKNQPYDPRASTLDFATALDKVGAGTAGEKLTQFGDYAKNVAASGGKKVLQKLGDLTGYTQHNANNQLLRNALEAEDITEKQYKLMGGYDVAQQFPGPQVTDDAMVGLSSLLYNAVKSGINIYDPQNPYAQYGQFSAPESIGLNMQGAKGLTATDKDIYQKIISGKPVKSKTPLSESDFYNQFYGMPYQPYQGKYFQTLQKGDPNYDAIRAADTYGKFSNLVDSGAIKYYTGPTDYKNYLSTFADGGRVGLFMGGDPLTGQALSIYNSMNAYGFQDQEIADALSAQGLYTAPGSTPDPTPDPGQTIGYQGGNDGPYAGQVVDQTDYGFNKKNYAPGEKLEINPAAFGVSFPEQPSGPKREGIINQTIDSFTSLPTRSLSSFASPTTGGNIVGPAEQGFMEQTLDIDPAGRTREEIRSLYDNYNRFTGRTSNFADARQKGKAGQVLGSLVGAAAGIPFLGKGIDMLSNAFGPQGDKSLQSKYTVDNAGFGSTGARDEFGLATFNKKDGFLGLTGNTTRNYIDRMSERLGELTDFFGSRIDDFDINNIDAATFNKMSKINGFYAKQVQAYKDRIEVERINREQKERERMEASATNRAEANAITNRLRDEFNRDSGGGFAVSGPDTSSNPTGASNRASQERGFSLHGAKGGSVPIGLVAMFKEKR